MKIQIASDLHIEHLARHYPGYRVITPAPDADLLVLAGDIHSGVHAVMTFADWPVPVLYVGGNHEHYGRDHAATRADLKAASKGTSVTVLDDEAVLFNGVRFLGTTLWTDYRFYPQLELQRALAIAENSIVDHRVISMDGQPFSAAMARAEHERSVKWLRQRLDEQFDGKTVVISHHAPHEASIHPRWQGTAANVCFASRLAHLVQKADVWIHGHMHDSFDYRVGRCRVLCNPRGYPRSRPSLPRDIQWENAYFEAELVLDL